MYFPRIHDAATMFLFSRLLPRSVHSSCAVLGPQAEPEVHSSQFVVCGAGAGGLAVASRLARKFGEGKVAIVDPAQVSCACTQFNPEEVQRIKLDCCLKFHGHMSCT